MPSNSSLIYNFAHELQEFVTTCRLYIHHEVGSSLDKHHSKGPNKKSSDILDPNGCHSMVARVTSDDNCNEFLLFEKRVRLYERVSSLLYANHPRP